MPSLGIYGGGKKTSHKRPKPVLRRQKIRLVLGKECVLRMAKLCAAID